MNEEQRALAERIYAWASAQEPQDATEFRYSQNDWVASPELAITFDTAEEPRCPITKLREGGCKTAACLAGAITLMTAPKEVNTDGVTLFWPNGDQEDMDKWAAKQLGMDHDVAQVIFYSNKVAALLRFRYWIDHPEATEDDVFQVGYELDLDLG
jgi:hypothetical protein